MYSEGMWNESDVILDTQTEISCGFSVFRQVLVNNLKQNEHKFHSSLAFHFCNDYFLHIKFGHFLTKEDGLTCQRDALLTILATVAFYSVTGRDKLRCKR
jgi:hypothetical protein